MALPRNISKGFTLLEITVVLMIIGMILAGGLTGLVSMVQQRQLDETNAKMKAIQAAIVDFRRAQGRIPCPGNITYAMNESHGYFGMEAANAGTCTGGTPAATLSDTSNVVGGLVPVKALNLPEDYAFDGWGHRFLYVVDKTFTSSSAFIFNPVTSIAGSIKISRGVAQSIGAQTGNSAVFVKSDSNTHGNWVGTYGSSGYYIQQDGTNLPTGSVTAFTVNWNCGSHYFANAVTGADENPSVDIRATPKGSNHAVRIASYNVFCNNGSTSTQSNMTVTVAPGSTVMFTVYMLDWYGYGYPAQLEFRDGSNPAILLNAKTVSGHLNGIYVSWNITGTVVLVLRPDGRQMGPVFIDPAATSIGEQPGIEALVSFGANGHGAYSRGATSAATLPLPTACDTTNTNELINCGFTGKFVQQLPYQNPSVLTDTFDDIVLYKMRSALRSANE